MRLTLKQRLNRIINVYCSCVEYFDIYDCFGVPNWCFNEGSYSRLDNTITIKLKNRAFEDEHGEYTTPYYAINHYKDKNRFTIRMLRNVGYMIFFDCKVDSLSFEDPTKTELTVKLSYSVYSY